MKDDYGFYGSGLDGYVHYRQGMAEAERNAPHLSEESDSFDSYDEPDSTMPASSAPEPSVSVSASPHSTPAAEQPADDPPPTDRELLGRWIRNPWNLALVISCMVFMLCALIDSAENTIATMRVAAITDMIFLIFLVIGIFRLVRWIFRYIF